MSVVLYMASNLFFCALLLFGGHAHAGKDTKVPRLETLSPTQKKARGILDERSAYAEKGRLDEKAKLERRDEDKLAKEGVIFKSDAGYIVMKRVAAFQSSTLKQMLEDTHDQHVTDMPGNISIRTFASMAKILGKIWQQSDDDKRNTVKNLLRGETEDNVHALLLAANYLDVRPVLDVVLERYAEQIFNKVLGNFKSAGYQAYRDKFLSPQVIPLDLQREMIKRSHVFFKRQFSFEGANVESISFSPDGNTIATRLPISVQLWRREVDISPLKIAIFSHLEEGDGNTAVFSPDNHIIAVGSNDGFARLWRNQATQGQNPMPLVTFEHNNHEPVENIAFTHDSNLIATASMNEVRLWRNEKIFTSVPQPLSILGHGEGVEVTSLAFSPDSHVIATAANSARLWRSEAIQSPQPYATLQHASDEAIWTVAFSPDGRLLATASNHELRLWRYKERETPEQVATLPYERVSGIADFRGFVFSSDSKSLAVRSRLAVTLYRLTANNQPKVISVFRFNQKTRVISMAFTPDNALLATSSFDHTTRLWRNRSDENPEPLTILPGLLGVNPFSPDGNYLLTFQAFDTSDKTLLWERLEEKYLDLTSAQIIAYIDQRRIEDPNLMPDFLVAALKQNCHAFRFAFGGPPCPT